MFYPLDTLVADIAILKQVRDDCKLGYYAKHRALRELVGPFVGLGNESAYKLAIIRSGYAVKTYNLKTYAETMLVERKNFDAYMRQPDLKQYICPTLWLDDFFAVQPTLEDVGSCGAPFLSADARRRLVDSGPHNWGLLKGTRVYFDFGGQSYAA